jgi:hypothetical protein
MLVATDIEFKTQLPLIDSCAGRCCVKKFRGVVRWVGKGGEAIVQKYEVINTDTLSKETSN